MFCFKAFKNTNQPNRPVHVEVAYGELTGQLDGMKGEEVELAPLLGGVPLHARGWTLELAGREVALVAVQPTRRFPLHDALYGPHPLAHVAALGQIGEEILDARQQVVLARTSHLKLGQLLLLSRLSAATVVFLAARLADLTRLEVEPVMLNPLPYHVQHPTNTTDIT